MISFYDHPKTGKLHFRATSGGGDATTSVFDAPATSDHVGRYPVEYGEYLRLKADGSVALTRAPSDIESRNLHISALEAQIKRLTRENERLNAILKGSSA